MTMFNKVSKSFRFGNHDVTLTTGEIARQATGACICQMDDTVVLATVVAKKETKPGQDFFPLTVDYIEKTYAAGKIPGGFFKREGRPSEKETLTSRLIDRPIRPLFPDGFFNEVQVIIHVLSADPAVDPDIPAMIGASAALAISGIPFRGPIGACRVGYINDEIVINPTTEELKTSRSSPKPASRPGTGSPPRRTKPSSPASSNSATPASRKPTASAPSRPVRKSSAKSMPPAKPSSSPTPKPPAPKLRT